MYIMKKKFTPMPLLSALISLLLVFAGCSDKDTVQQADTGSDSGLSELSIYHFNAGKADACIISDSKHYVMIDTGEYTLSDEILSYFDNQSITSLDCLIITHFDKDHVGSASAVIDNINIDSVLQSNVPKDSEYYDSYIDSLEKKNITPTTVSGNYEFSLGNMSFNINGPEIVYTDDESNNSSLITSLFYGDRSFIFMGDAQNDRLKDFISGNSQKYDYVKIPYHGNYQKQLDNLMENIEPSYAVITSSEKEPEDSKMTGLLNDLNINYYLTRNGAVSTVCDGKNITITQ